MKMRLCFRGFGISCDLTSSGREVLIKHVEKRHWFKPVKSMRLLFGYQKSGLKTTKNEYDEPSTALEGCFGHRLEMKRFRLV